MALPAHGQPLDAPAPPRPEVPPARWQLLCAYALALLLGFAMGVVGAFVSPAGVRLAGHSVPLGVTLALAGNVVVAVLAWRGTASRGGPALALVGWLVAVVPLSGSTGEGDIVLAAGRQLGTRSLALIAGGVLAYLLVLVIAAARPTPLSAPPR